MILEGLNIGGKKLHVSSYLSSNMDCKLNVKPFNIFIFRMLYICIILIINIVHVDYRNLDREEYKDHNKNHPLSNHLEIITASLLVYFYFLLLVFFLCIT